MRNFYGIALLVLLGACGSREKVAAVYPYFSIRDFMFDQFTRYRDVPVTFEEKHTENGDSAKVTYGSFYQLETGDILRTFAESDISDSLLKAQYEYEWVVDTATSTATLMYKAKSPAMLTQKLDIALRMRDSRIKSVYIEKHKKSFWKTTDEKLWYSVGKNVSIQRRSQPLIGTTREELIELGFLL